ncbi:MAG: MATE family efflux transporter [Oscillospiraceae bacterium]|nr:MATE family efflux transporter [Oscillospiraceae bacterium]
MSKNVDKIEIFERMSVPRALAKMAIPTIISQLITLIYNIADTWFIGQTDNPYMVAASSLVLTVFLMTAGVSNLFGVGGGSLVVRLLGSKDEEEAAKAASYSLMMAGIAALIFSVLCLIFMEPLLRLLGASDNTIGYAKQYLTFVVVIGGVPTVLSSTMSSMLRNIGYSKEAGFGLGMGGVLNVILDPIFMFLLLPDGYEVVGAAMATMLSNVISLIYFILVYRRVQKASILALPKRLEKIRKDSLQSIFSVGIPAAVSLLLYDLTNMVINGLSASHGDFELAAMGIVLKVERLPQNIGIGICLGMMPLVAYNYAAKNYDRMKAFFSASRLAGVAVAIFSLVVYRMFAAQFIQAFISDPQTVVFGTEFLKIRCFAPGFMFLSFHLVHFMQAVDRGRVSLWLAVIRQLGLNIPILFLMNLLFGMTGVVWTQTVADIINVVISYIIYHRVIAKVTEKK